MDGWMDGWMDGRTDGRTDMGLYLDNVDEFLLVGHWPVDLVVVSGPKINHYVLVSVEKHNRRGVVQLVHGIEVGNLCDVHEISARVGTAISHLLMQRAVDGAY